MDHLKIVFWYIFGYTNAALHPDSAVLALKHAGISNLNVVISIVLASTLWTALVYFLLLPIMKWARGKARSKYTETVEKITFWVVSRNGYFGLIVLTCIPIIPGIRKISMAAGQFFGMKYILPVVLPANAFRITCISIVILKLLY